MPQLIEHLQKSGVLHSLSLTKAFYEIDRADFVPEDYQNLAYEDTALPIAGGQTISQPYTVAFMLEQLCVRTGDCVLEVGYGSGWQTALLANLVGRSGKVCAFEIVPELCTQGKRNVSKYPQLATRVEFQCRNAADGYKDAAPFDCIIAAAEVQLVPQAWRDQLRTGGRMVYPIHDSLVLEIKQKNASFEISTFPGFVFVPFIETN